MLTKRPISCYVWKMINELLSQSLTSTFILQRDSFCYFHFLVEKCQMICNQAFLFLLINIKQTFDGKCKYHSSNRSKVFDFKFSSKNNLQILHLFLIISSEGTIIHIYSYNVHFPLEKEFDKYDVIWLTLNTLMYINMSNQAAEIAWGHAVTLEFAN